MHRFLNLKGQMILINLNHVTMAEELDGSHIFPHPSGQIHGPGVSLWFSPEFCIIVNSTIAQIEALSK